ncbi:uncharacterized protein FA14DRAFT_174357 [Meira miltonrushii]|uniref:CoA-dependent acyltransferase n=1 Tax=Meira miltonrushii TaxID=1280837 RepID=A0A316V546_9BASI|nr:uncharacterized protein FA14DRAFT_174357 [Meira miltonrushii]PWN32660.1 hypothetical protein FA14DRAFT_174357 [Meira miltonrushii]
MSEWQVINDNTLQRDLKGAEFLINATEQHQGGNYQLIFTVTLDTNIPHDRLRTRFGPAYLALRRQYPLLGIEYAAEQLEKASCKALQNSKEAKEWLKLSTQTVHISTSDSVNNFGRRVAQEPLKTPNRVCKTYLVLGPKQGQAGLVLHTSHALTGHYSVRVMDTFAKLLAEEEFEKGIDATFEPEDLKLLASRLPGSLEDAYKKKYKPSPDDISEELRKRQTIANSEQTPKLGIPVHRSFANRRSLMQNLLVQFDKYESKRILSGIKRMGISPTTAVFASILCATHKLFPGQNRGFKGCTLNFSTHASRYLPCEGQTGEPVVSMAIVPSAIWIPTKAQDFEKADSTVILKFAKIIAKEQDEFLKSPHSMAYASEIAQMLKSSPSAGTQETQIEKSNAVLTSQGPMPISYGHQNGANQIKIVDYNHFGRNTDPTVCFALYSVHASLRIATISDEKFFEVALVDKVLRTVGDIIRGLQVEVQDSARL